MQKPAAAFRSQPTAPAPHSRLPTSHRPLRPSSRRLWTAVSNHSSLWRTECAYQPSDQARDREAPHPRLPISNRPLRTSPGSRGSAFAPPNKQSPPPNKQPKALDCCEQSQLSLAHGVRLPALRTSPGSRGSVFAPPNKQSSPPNKPGIARLRTRPLPSLPTSPFTLPPIRPSAHPPIRNNHLPPPYPAPPILRLNTHFHAIPPSNPNGIASPSPRLG
jgi:hypothetical protein